MQDPTNAPRKSRKLYRFAATIVPSRDLREVPHDSRFGVDRLARALEINGSGPALYYRTSILVALGKHMRAAYTDAREAQVFLAWFDRRTAVWATCVLARMCLADVPADDPRPLAAIEVTERWLAGAATLEEVRAARKGAYARGVDPAVLAGFMAACSTAGGTNARCADTRHAVDIVDATTRVCVRRRGVFSDWRREAKVEHRRLVGVIADALPGLPPEALA